VVTVGDAVSEAADYAAREVEQHSEHPRMAVAQAVSEHGVSEDKRETVLRLVEDQTGAAASTDGGRARSEGDRPDVDDELRAELEERIGGEVIGVDRDEDGYLLIRVDDQGGESA